MKKEKNKIKHAPICYVQDAFFILCHPYIGVTTMTPEYYWSELVIGLLLIVM